jgi:hypothetical protein
VVVLTWLAVAGLMLSASALLFVIGVGVAQIVGAEPSKPHVELFESAWIRLGIGAAVVGVAVAILAIMANSSLAKQRRERPLEITFREADGKCARNAVAKRGEPEYPTVSVRARNESDLGLQEVRLKVVERPLPLVHYFLRLQHDPEPYVRSVEGESCSPKEELYFDVAQFRRAEGVKLTYAHAVLFEHVGIPAVPLENLENAPEIELKAEGRWEDDGFAPSSFKRFAAYITPDGILLLKEVSDA